jgi:pimeloyl-ACP methyl ester carboxylesterase
MTTLTATISADFDVQLEADVTVPPEPVGVVVFAHGSGSSRHSPRNRAVAGLLNDGDLATVLADLLTRKGEEADSLTGEHRFDIALLGARVVDTLEWVESQPLLGKLPVGLFGASTGAAAALLAAAWRPTSVHAVVSRGGRPDLADDALELVRAPTLLIVGGRDEQVLELNRRALARLHALAQLEIVPGATHLFEEPGALEQVATLSRDWFLQHLVANP